MNIFIIPLDPLSVLCVCICVYMLFVPFFIRVEMSGTKILIIVQISTVNIK